MCSDVEATTLLEVEHVAGLEVLQSAFSAGACLEVEELVDDAVAKLVGVGASIRLGGGWRGVVLRAAPVTVGCTAVVSEPEAPVFEAPLLSRAGSSRLDVTDSVAELN